MPPYLDSKALPTPTQYFIFNFFLISFPMRYEIWKGRKTCDFNNALVNAEINMI